MLNFREAGVSKAMDSVTAMTVKSALNPVLWLCGIITLPVICIASFLSSPPFWLILFGATPILLAVIGFLYLLFFDRDRLQSENYQIRKQSLELIEQKDDLQPAYANTIEAIANPDWTALPNEKSEVGK